jgi:hypothetical protein
VTERPRRLNELYEAIEQLRADVGGGRQLASSTSRSGWPDRGVYLFFEPGELREDGTTPRVTRVGTHALTATSRTTLWRRLAQHRGTVGGSNPGGGNHRGSVFRLHVGTALIARDGWSEAAPTWGVGTSAPAEVRLREQALEREVSRVIGSMTVLWVDIPERVGRGAIERGLIGLLSNAGRDAIDPASKGWLGNFASRPAIRQSHLWNVNHVGEHPSGDGLAAFGEAVRHGARREH